ncbi:hypothetical protein GGF32_000072 [Allomyces javanicus]|nr:hypothetical protein GGF32_000072 [Allomyces javanicus]
MLARRRSLADELADATATQPLAAFGPHAGRLDRDLALLNPRLRARAAPSPPAHLPTPSPPAPPTTLVAHRTVLDHKTVVTTYQYRPDPAAHPKQPYPQQHLQLQHPHARSWAAPSPPATPPTAPTIALDDYSDFLDDHDADVHDVPPSAVRLSDELFGRDPHWGRAKGPVPSDEDECGRPIPLHLASDSDLDTHNAPSEHGHDTDADQDSDLYDEVSFYSDDEYDDEEEEEDDLERQDHDSAESRSSQPVTASLPGIGGRAPQPPLSSDDAVPTIPLAAIFRLPRTSSPALPTSAPSTASSSSSSTRATWPPVGPAPVASRPPPFPVSEPYLPTTPALPTATLAPIPTDSTTTVAASPALPAFTSLEDELVDAECKAFENLLSRVTRQIQDLRASDEKLVNHINAIDSWRSTAAVVTTDMDAARANAAGAQAKPSPIMPAGVNDRRAFQSPRRPRESSSEPSKGWSSEPRPAVRENRTLDRTARWLREQTYRLVHHVGTCMRRRDLLEALSAIRTLPRLGSLESRFLTTLGGNIASVPVLTQDPRDAWSTMVAELVDRTEHDMDPTTWDDARVWRPPVTFAAALARGVGRRQLVSHQHQVVSIMQQLALSVHGDQGDDAVDATGALVFMLTNVGRHVDAIAVYDRVPPHARSLKLMGTVASAYAANGDPQGVRDLMVAAVDAGHLPRPSDNFFLNLALINASAAAGHAEGALAALRDVTAQLPPRGGADAPWPHADKASAVEIEPERRPELFERVLYFASKESKYAVAESAQQLAHEFSVALNATSVCALMNLALTADNVAGAVAYWDDWMRDHSDYLLPRQQRRDVNSPPPNAPLVQTAIEALFRAKRFDDLRALHHDAVTAHRLRVLVLTGPYFTRVIKAMHAIYGYDAALSAFEEMKSLGLAPHPAQTAFLEYVHPDQVRERRKRVRSAKSPTSATPDFGTDPAEVTDAPVKWGQVRTGESPATAAEIELNTAIRAALYVGDLSRAYALLTDRVKAHAASKAPGAPVQSSTIGLFLEHFASHGNVDAMDKMLARAKEIGVYDVTANPVVRAVLVKGFSRGKRYDRVFAEWDAIVRDGVVPVAALQSSVLDACGFARDEARLDQVVKQLQDAPWGGHNVNVWTSAVEAYCRQHRIADAVRVARDVVPSKGLSPDRKLVGTLLTVEPDVNRPLEKMEVLRYLASLGENLIQYLYRPHVRPALEKAGLNRFWPLPDTACR